MGILTAQKIALYFERYKNVDVTFSKDMVQVTGLVAEQVHLKCGSAFFPCFLFATSFQGAKVVANVKSDLMNKINQANNMISLRYCFKSLETGSPITFFVSGKVMGSVPYKNSKEISLLSIQFTQRPPDDLIEVLGRILDANANSTKNKDEQIPITPESQRSTKLLSKEVACFIQGVPRRCILREMSFFNAKIIMVGVAKFLIDKETALRFDFDDPRESFLVKGKFSHADNVEGKKEMAVLTIQYDEASIPMGYKLRINDFFNTVSAQNRAQNSDAPAGAQ